MKYLNEENMEWSIFEIIHEYPDNIYLDIVTDKDKKTIEHVYYARYFKTSDASDHSETNIESYRTWY